MPAATNIRCNARWKRNNPISLDNRLTLAVEAGAVVLPAGRVLAIGARGDTDLSAVPNAEVVTSFKPDYDLWSERGRAVHKAIAGPADGAVIFLPRAKQQARDWIARALALGCPVAVDGHKTSGIDSMLKALRSEASVGAPFAKAHGKVFTVEPTTAFAHWQQPDLVEVGGWKTAPGAFSADGPDPASAALADALPPLAGRVADLGAGWGFLSAKILEQDKVGHADLVEADCHALEAARANINDPRAQFHWADALSWQAEPYDHIVSNPPFHTERRADPALGIGFIRRAARLLAPSGTFWLVANRHLPYEAALSEEFGQVTELPGPPAFKLIRASRPARKRR